MSTLPPPRRPVPKGTKTAEILHAAENHSHHEDEHFEEPSEKWLVAYADLMTLLFGFFVLMYSMSNIDKAKFAAAAQSSSERFGGDYQDPTENLTREIAKELRSIPEISNQVEVTKKGQSVELNFRGQVLFLSGESQMSEEGQKLLTTVGEEIKKLGNEFTVRVEGHTDDIPISTPKFPSNWELSSSRAIEVVKLFRAQGIAPRSLEAIGYADTRPMAPNRTPAGTIDVEGTSKNRRVMIRIERRSN